MSKDKIADYDGTTAGNNTDIGGISIAEGMLPSAVNNSMRELTKQLGAFANGTDAIDALTVTGAATVNGAFTSPGIDDNADATAITIDSSENVGIGTTSPNGNGALTINAATNNSPQIVFTENDTAKWLIGHRHDGDHFRFYDLGNSAERVRIQSGGGISFNGDTAAANALDDYEQGTWTPSVGGSATYTTQAGHYIKIGDMVFITGTLAINNISGAAHTNYLDGLPYNSVAGNGREGFIGVQYFANLASTGTYFALRTNGDRLYGSAQRENDNTMVVNPDIFTNSTEVTFGGSYFVA